MLMEQGHEYLQIHVEDMIVNICVKLEEVNDYKLEIIWKQEYL